MRKKQEDQTEIRHDQLVSQYNGIGIKAVAAAVEPGRPEADAEKRSRGNERLTPLRANKDE